MSFPITALAVLLDQRDAQDLLTRQAGPATLLSCSPMSASTQPSTSGWATSQASTPAKIRLISCSGAKLNILCYVVCQCVSYALHPRVGLVSFIFSDT